MNLGFFPPIYLKRLFFSVYFSTLLFNMNVNIFLSILFLKLLLMELLTEFRFQIVQCLCVALCPELVSGCRVSARSGWLRVRPPRRCGRCRLRTCCVLSGSLDARAQSPRLLFSWACTWRGTRYCVRVVF